MHGGLQREPRRHGEGESGLHVGFVPVGVVSPADAEGQCAALARHVLHGEGRIPVAVGRFGVVELVSRGQQPVPAQAARAAQGLLHRGPEAAQRVPTAPFSAVVIAHVAAQHVVSGQFVVALRGTAIVGAAQQDDAVASRPETELLTRRVGRHTVAQRGAEREALVQVPLQVQAEGGEGIDVDVEVVVEGRVAAVTGVGKEAREFGVEVMLVGLQQSGEHLQPAFPRLAQPCVHQAGGAAFRVDRGEILPHVDQLRSYVPGGQSARLGLCPLPQWHGQAGIDHAVPGRGRVLEAALPLRE